MGGDGKETWTDECKKLTVTLTVEAHLWESRNFERREARNNLRWAVRTALEGDYMREVSKDNVYDVQKKV